MTDEFLSKIYTKSYTCWDFACEVWLKLTGKPLPVGHVDVSQPPYELHAIAEKHATVMQKLEQPVSPCVVLMQRKRVNPHVGIYYNGKILHLKPSGAAYEPLQHVTACYTEVSYYA